MVKYSYKYKVIKGKYKGETIFISKKKGDNFVKNGDMKFIDKYELKYSTKHGTVLSPVKKKVK